MIIHILKGVDYDGNRQKLEIEKPQKTRKEIDENKNTSSR